MRTITTAPQASLGLAAAITAASQAALESGAREPIRTVAEVCRDPRSGLPYLLHTMRDAAGRERSRRSRDASRGNPFLPFDEALLVRMLSDSHVALLNKFNVLEGHLLMVTRAFESQDGLLTLDDFRAFSECLLETPGLAFYNAGELAGASQSHKHLQFVPLPLASELPSLPIEALIEPGAGRVSGWTFRHALEELPASATAKVLAAALEGVYARLRDRLELGSSAAAYNLLITRNWMLLVPRRLARIGALEVNALAFAGSFFARSREDAEVLRDEGWQAVLERVTETCSESDRSVGAGDEGSGA